MKSDKLIDAIGMIDDRYIDEAHETKRKKAFVIDMSLIKKTVLAAACVLLAVTIIPNVFRMGNAKNSQASGSGYYEASYDGAYAADEGYPASQSEYYANGGAEASTFDAKKVQDNKKLILTSNLNLETQNIDDVIDSMLKLIGQYNGYVQRSSTYTQANGSRIYDATIRIPADQYADFLNETKALGNSTSYHESVEDVTDSYMDIEARLTSLRAQEEKVLEFYDRAESIEDLMAVEERLSDLRYQIEYYESQIKNYDLLVAYSTMNLCISETKVYTPTSTSFLKRLGNSFVNGWRNFIDSIGDFIIDLVYNIWSILFFLILLFVGYRLYRFIRRKISDK